MLVIFIYVCPSTMHTHTTLTHTHTYIHSYTHSLIRVCVLQEAKVFCNPEAAAVVYATDPADEMNAMVDTLDQR
jgi:hypothetical protein